MHGWSRGYDPSSYAWGDQMWTGRQLPGGIIYEMHVGTFTEEGTLAAAIDHLDHLVRLGVDFVELMPVNDFNGPHNWGYDGVLWYAVHEEYGGPAGYQLFVDACHQVGLGVIQDVVYNHLGPSGNYLPQFAPYLNEGGLNTWGESPNLDGEDSDEVRRYIIDNAMMWLNDYHVDGLRLDAVHALHDTRATHILEEMSIEATALSTFVGRPLSLIAESDLNDPRLITAREGGGYGLDRAVERRLPPRALRQPDRRHQRLLRRLRLPGRAGQGVRERLLPRRHPFHLPRPDPRPPHRHPAYADLAPGRLLGQPRPDRQPGRRRPALDQGQPGATGDRRHGHPAQPVHPDDLHGGGVGREHPVAVLHLPSRAGAVRPGP